MEQTRYRKRLVTNHLRREPDPRAASEQPVFGIALQKVGRDAPAGTLDDAFAECQADPGTLIFRMRVQPPEHFEYCRVEPGARFQFRCLPPKRSRTVLLGPLRYESPDRWRRGI